MGPRELRDAGFDRYVDLALLCKAWDEKNASVLADVALQFREGERVLLRPHRGFSSQQLLEEAARIATETKQTEALQRLRKIVEATGSTELKAKLAGAEKLAGEARASDPALQVSIAEMTPDVFAELWEILTGHPRRQSRGRYGGPQGNPGRSGQQRRHSRKAEEIPEEAVAGQPSRRGGGAGIAEAAQPGSR